MSDWFMGFTEDEPDETDEEAGPVPLGPPEDEVPGVVPVEVLLGWSEDAAVLLTGLRVFPTGVAMVLGVRLRRPVPDMETSVWADVFDHDLHGEPGDDQWRAGRLRWGFTFSGRGEVDNLGAGSEMITLHGGGGGGNDLSCDRDYWLAPLPPAGSLSASCTWPRMSIAPTTTELDTGSIREAAARSRRIWP